MEPKDIDVLQKAFEEVRAKMRIDRKSDEARQMARYLFDLYASGVATVPELVTRTVTARTKGYRCEGG